MKRAIVLLVTYIVLLAAATASAKAHWKPGLHNQMHAVVWGFCGGHDSLKHPCTYGVQALVVARHEAGAFHWLAGTCSRARNGQYEGCFQMGTSERLKYGDGNNPWAQSRAAYRYFRITGFSWSPWSCKPSGYCY